MRGRFRSLDNFCRTKRDSETGPLAPSIFFRGGWGIMETTPAPGFFDKLGTQSIDRSVTALVALFLVIIGSQIAFVSFGLGLLGGVRSYVGGEGLWSKAEKDAVHHLTVYLSSRNADDYGQFRAKLGVTIGDRKARL